MRPQQISTSVSPETKRQFQELISIYGTGSTVLTVAIDRLHQAKFPKEAKGANETT